MYLSVCVCVRVIQNYNLCVYSFICVCVCPFPFQDYSPFPGVWSRYKNKQKLITAFYLLFVCTCVFVCSCARVCLCVWNILYLDSDIDDDDAAAKAAAVRSQGKRRPLHDVGASHRFGQLVDGVQAVALHAVAIHAHQANGNGWKWQCCWSMLWSPY